jgi:hypothetical protein
MADSMSRRAFETAFAQIFGNNVEDYIGQGGLQRAQLPGLARQIVDAAQQNPRRTRAFLDGASVYLKAARPFQGADVLAESFSAIGDGFVEFASRNPNEAENRLTNTLEDAMTDNNNNNGSGAATTQPHWTTHLTKEEQSNFVGALALVVQVVKSDASASLDAVRATEQAIVELLSKQPHVGAQVPDMPKETHDQIVADVTALESAVREHRWADAEARDIALRYVVRMVFGPFLGAVRFSDTTSGSTEAAGDALRGVQDWLDATSTPRGRYYAKWIGVTGFTAAASFALMMAMGSRKGAVKTASSFAVGILSGVAMTALVSSLTGELAQYLLWVFGIAVPTAGTQDTIVQLFGAIDGITWATVLMVIGGIMAIVAMQLTTVIDHIASLPKKALELVPGSDAGARFERLVALVLSKDTPDGSGGESAGAKSDNPGELGRLAHITGTLATITLLVGVAVMVVHAVDWALKLGGSGLGFAGWGALAFASITGLLAAVNMQRGRYPLGDEWMGYRKRLTKFMIEKPWLLLPIYVVPGLLQVVENGLTRAGTAFAINMGALGTLGGQAVLLFGGFVLLIWGKDLLGARLEPVRKLVAIGIVALPFLIGSGLLDNKAAPSKTQAVMEVSSAPTSAEAAALSAELDELEALLE